jgi:hypothetical protein
MITKKEIQCDDCKKKKKSVLKIDWSKIKLFKDLMKEVRKRRKDRD